MTMDDNEYATKQSSSLTSNRLQYKIETPNQIKPVKLSQHENLWLSFIITCTNLVKARMTTRHPTLMSLCDLPSFTWWTYQYLSTACIFCQTIFFYCQIPTCFFALNRSSWLIDFKTNSCQKSDNHQKKVSIHAQLACDVGGTFLIISTENPFSICAQSS